MTKIKHPAAPETVADAELDQASGGLVTALLLPAVQKVPAPRETAASFTGGVFVGVGDVKGDGSV